MLAAEKYAESSRRFEEVCLKFQSNRTATICYLELILARFKLKLEEDVNNCYDELDDETSEQFILGETEALRQVRKRTL